MNQTTKIIISIIVVVLVIFGIYSFFGSGNKTSDSNSSSMVSSGFDSKNPFDVNVNPLQGYKNPFSK